MLGPVGAKPEVLWSVVGRVPVDVVYHFLGLEISPENSLHDESVLKDVGN